MREVPDETFLPIRENFPRPGLFKSPLAIPKSGWFWNNLSLFWIFLNLPHLARLLLYSS
jgi:hypothetical protein